MSIARFDAGVDGVMSPRDLASVELWQRSLARSRQRRRLSELGRKTRRRRNSVSLALSAALAAGPVLPQGVAAADSSAGSGAADTADGGGGPSAAAAGLRVVLELGSRGPLVAAAQRRLNEVLPFTHLVVDGIYGPLTRGAVVNFQRQHGFAATGALDVRTWASMFDAPVLIIGGGRSSTNNVPASGMASATNARSRRSLAVEKATAAPSDRRPRVTARAGDVGASRSASARAASRIAASAEVSERSGVGGSAMGRPAPRAASAISVTTAPGGTSGERGVAQAAGTGGSGLASHVAPEGASGAPAGVGTTGTGSPRSSGAPSVTVVAPTDSTPQTSTYVLTDGVALPLPRAYVTNPYVDQGVDYAAPGGTPLYAMGDGVIVGAGISGFGPNAPILKITSGPLEGLEVYYGHSGPNLVHVGEQVKAGQPISQVGYGIVGISTGPHLEIGFYPPGPTGSGSRMLSVIDSLVGEHPSGRVWGAGATVAHAAVDVTHTTRAISLRSTSSAKRPSTRTSSAGRSAERHPARVGSTGAVSRIASGGVAAEAATASAPTASSGSATTSGAATSSAPTTTSAPAMSSPVDSTPAGRSAGASRSPQAVTSDRSQNAVPAARSTRSPSTTAAPGDSQSNATATTSTPAAPSAPSTTTARTAAPTTSGPSSPVSPSATTTTPSSGAPGAAAPSAATPAPSTAATTPTTSAANAPSTPDSPSAPSASPSSGGAPSGADASAATPMPNSDGGARPAGGSAPAPSAAPTAAAQTDTSTAATEAAPTGNPPEGAASAGTVAGEPTSSQSSAGAASASSAGGASTAAG